MSEPDGSRRPAGPGLARVVLDRLKERILDGRITSGSRISIDEVRVEFGVSKQPVMDAMRRLEATGIVEIVPQSGCRVQSYTAVEVEDFFRLFGSFESEIAAAAAVRRTDAQVGELDAAWAAIEGVHAIADDTERARRYRQLNREFHLVIHRMAHSRIMAEQSERMWDLSDFLISATGGASTTSGVIVDRNHDHDVIRSAIRQRRVEVARAAMVGHITASVEPERPHRSGIDGGYRRGGRSVPPAVPAPTTDLTR
ncbi:MULTISPECIES: GntR family transcriptional regulator [unclassified Rhodococcus (in: high G+C Gram-positive bacteria)]|uniref:GntR family transcriptional regulator n=1 Tax=unclassified Rhodococcus (in: high G+C Gram-positive bacteria) TaxID=192944 RepID=UPI0009E8B36E|nr:MULTISPECIES: GntR family transcriptional regulator [unclassified Rhodococcus (in: high G+C Gram-positive bacteria)]